MTDRQRDRVLFLRILKCLDEGGYALVKILDAFFDLSASQQDAFVAWSHKRIEDERWDEVASDRMQYKEFIKALVMHHSGMEVKGEPTLTDLKAHIGEYLKSDEYESACKCVKYEEEPSFTEQLEEL